MARSAGTRAPVPAIKAAARGAGASSEGMLAFFFGLLTFLREIYVATVSLRIGPREHGP
jgi:hypothetical protein